MLIQVAYFYVLQTAKMKLKFYNTNLISSFSLDWNEKKLALNLSTLYSLYHNINYWVYLFTELCQAL